MTAATSPEELADLMDLCRAGKLFDVQRWIALGKPVGFAKDVKVKGTTRTPLRVAMESGFHSLVQVLLEAGAEVRSGRYNALEDAVGMRRADLASLLIQHGAQVADVSMVDVLELWNPGMVELFLANGANLVDGHPVAYALIHKMRPVLGLLKRFGDDAAVMKQGEMALRHHADKGNTKWVSLLLWAGANPWARGPYWLEDLDDDEEEPDGRLSALDLAAQTGKLDVLKIKGMLKAMSEDRASTDSLLTHACHASDGEVLTWLLDRGHRPDALEDRGSSAIDSLLRWMSWEEPSVYLRSWPADNQRSSIDSSRARERMKMIHLLVVHGAKWLPADRQTIGEARRNLLKMTRDYVLEFAWLMQTYRSARRADMEELIRTPSVAGLLGDNLDKLRKIVAGTPEDP